MSLLASGAEEVRTTTFPRTVKSVQDAAFGRRKRLQFVVLNEGLEHVGKLAGGGQYYGGAFEKTRLRHVRLPSTLKTLGDNTFQWCEQLRSVSFAGNNSLTEIGDGCFSCSGLEEFRAPQSLRKIANRAFYFCERLRLVDLNEGLVALGRTGRPSGIGVFAGAQFEEVELPATLRTLGDGAF